MADEEQLPAEATAESTRAVDFYGEELTLAIAAGASYVALRPISDYLGLNWSGQIQRTNRDEVLTRHLRTMTMTGADGRQREMVSLQLEYLPGWLFGITASRVREELREKLTRYREECFNVLWRAFQSEIQPATPAPASTSLAQVRDIALAVAAMAEQQIALQEQVGAHQQRLERAAVVVGDLQRRVSVVEERTAPAAFISDGQAAEISAKVKALAELLTGKDANRNHYQGIFSELYRRWGVSSYKAIHRGDYAAVVGFLDDWRQAATRGEPPQQGSLF